MRARVSVTAGFLLLVPAMLAGQAVIVGEVFDSTTATPLAGARIMALGPGTRTVTDSRGVYRLELEPGSYTLLLHHPRLESLPIPIPLRELHVSDGETRRMDFHLPSMATILSRACGRQPGGVLVGRVRDELLDDELGGARVRVRAPNGEVSGEHETRTDANGIYRFCGLPTGLELSVSADFHGQGPHAVSVNLPQDRAVLLDFDLDVTGPSRVVGRVLDAQSGEPVAHVVLSMTGRGGTQITDADGRFLFQDLPPGIYGLETTHIAYGGRTDSVVVGGNEVVDVEIRMDAEVLKLPPVVVVSRSRPLIAASHMSTFESRRMTGNGYYITREEIERVSPYSITGLLRRVPGVHVVPNGFGTYSILMARQPMRLSSRRPEDDVQAPPSNDPRQTALGQGRNDPLRNPEPGPCTVNFFLDGGPIRLAEGESIDRLVPVHTVAGMEVYRGASEIPIGIFGSDNRCGAIVIWTHHGE